MADSIDYLLYLVTDRSLSLGRSNIDVVTAAIKGGVSCVQLREKHLDTRAFLREAVNLKALLAPRGIPLIINDRLDIALAVEADGVHLGQNDMPIADARRLLPSSTIIGVSAECLGDAMEAAEQGADYIGISPVYATPTKTDTSVPLGLDGISEIRRHVTTPLVGIGGITADNASQVIAAGADGVAVVSAITSAAAPDQAAAKLLQKLRPLRKYTRVATDGHQGTL
ncbi:MAG: thiamine phosphate synthase [Desulfopila sp.]